MLKLVSDITLAAADALRSGAEPVALPAAQLAATVGASFLCSAGTTFAYISGAAGMLGCFACTIGSFAVGIAVYGLC